MTESATGDTFVENVTYQSMFTLADGSQFILAQPLTTARTVDGRIVGRRYFAQPSIRFQDSGWLALTEGDADRIRAEPELALRLRTA